MARTILGVDIGYESLKLALCQNGAVRKLAIAPMPQHLIREGRLVSTDSTGDLIRGALKEAGIRASHAAVVLSDEMSFVRNVTVPKMGAEQLALNLPYEFGDYISDELRKYAFDYAMVSTPDELKAPDAESMELMATAVPLDYLEELKETMRKAGLKLVKAAPVASAYVSLLRRFTPFAGALSGRPPAAGPEMPAAGPEMPAAGPEMPAAGPEMPAAGPETSVTLASLTTLSERPSRATARESALSGGPAIATGLNREFCIIDLGYRAIRIHMFHGERFDTTRELESGMQLLDQIVADDKDVDVHLAHAYLAADFEGCQTSEVCMAAYDRIAVEIVRVLNFYRFSNPDSTLSDLWLVGGGAANVALVMAIAQAVDMNVHYAGELVPGAAIAGVHSHVQAIGITID